MILRIFQNKKITILMSNKRGRNNIILMNKIVVSK